MLDPTRRVKPPCWPLGVALRRLLAANKVATLWFTCCWKVLGRAPRVDIRLQVLCCVCLRNVDLAKREKWGGREKKKLLAKRQIAGREARGSAERWQQQQQQLQLRQQQQQLHSSRVSTQSLYGMEEAELPGTLRSLVLIFLLLVLSIPSCF